MTGEWTWTSGSPAGTAAIGRTLGGLLKPGAIILLYGDLGAGKTQLARGLAEGLGVTTPVTSPTFTLINEYEGRLPFYHCDLFRLEEPAQLLDLGLDEYLYGDGVTAIEWPERLGPLRPAEYLAISLTPIPDGRRLAFSAVGAGYEALGEELARILASEGRPPC